MKFLEENIGSTLFDINHSKILFDLPPRVMEIKKKIQKWDPIKHKIFCTAKETINTIKRQHTEWEKIITKEATDKGLISKIYKQMIQLNIKKNKKPNQKMGRRIHKSSLGKFKKIEIIPVIYSDHSAVRLDLNDRKKIIKNSNIWRLNNTLLNNQQIIEEIKKEIKISIEMNENENTTPQNLWDTVKAVLRGRFIAWQAYLKKQEKSQINNLTLHLKQLEK